MQAISNFEVGDITQLSFGDAHFDAVYSLEVGCDDAEKRTFDASAAWVLTPGGLFRSWDWALTRTPNEEEWQVVDAPTMAAFFVGAALNARLAGCD